MKRFLLLIGIVIVVTTSIYIYKLSYTIGNETLPAKIVTPLKPIQYTSEKKTMPLNVVAIGDSLTKGVGDANHEGYAGYTIQLLRNNKLFSSVHLNNYGIRGDTTDDLLKVLKRKDVLTHIQNSQFIFLTIGGNDILNVLKKHFLNLKASDFTHPRSHYESNLKLILSTLEKNNPRATVFYLGLFNPFQDYFDNLGEFNHIINQWNTLSQSVLSHYPHMIYVPTFDLFSGQSKTLFSQDHLHPNAQGYHLMTNRLYQYITQFRQ